MKWTRFQTAVVLPLSAIGLVAAVLIQSYLDSKVNGIRDRGRMVVGRVVAIEDHYFLSFLGDEPILEYEIDGQTHTVGVMHWISDDLPKGAMTNTWVDPSNPELVATFDGYSSTFGMWLPKVIGLLSLGGILGALTGRVNQRRRRRALERFRSAEKSALDKAAASGIVRRRDPYAMVVFWICFVGLALITVLNPGAILVSAAAFGSIGYACYLMTWEHEVVVTPTELLIRTPFRVHRVPRHLLEGVSLEEDGRLRLMLNGRPAVTVLTGISELFDGDRRPAQLKAAGRLRAALEAVELQPSAATRVETRPRHVLIGLSVLATISLAAVLIAWETGAFS